MDRSTLAAHYRAAQAQSGGACPIEAGTVARLADHECPHGRLPYDRTPTCGCWPQEGAALVLFPQRPAQPARGRRAA